MEFKYDGVPDETFNKHQDVPTKYFYWMKKTAFPYCYWKYAPEGKWYGKRTIFKPKFLNF